MPPYLIPTPYPLPEKLPTLLPSTPAQKSASQRAIIACELAVTQLIADDLAYDKIRASGAVPEQC